MSVGVRAAERNVDGAISSHAFELLHGQLVLFYGFVEQCERVFIDFGLFGSVAHLLLDLLQLNGGRVTSW